jgi:hypothetical protein
MRTSLTFALTSLLVAGATPGLVAAAPGAGNDHPSPGSMKFGTCGTVADTVDHRSELERAAPISNVIFLNRCIGTCQITKVENGLTDSRLDWSETPVGGDVLLPQFDITEEEWTDLLACVQDGFAPYDIVVTDVDPGDDSHHETMVSGTPQMLGLPADILGISRLSSTCEPYDNSISFAFAMHPAHRLGDGARVEELCTTIVHEVGHAYGMEHAHFCEDVMTYIADECGERKYFRDELMQCGEGFGTNDPDPSDDIRPCTCGGSRQNTHLKMSLVFDPNPESLPPPEVIVSSPAPDSTVVDGFPIFANADGGLRGLGRYEVNINGYTWLSEELHDYGEPDLLIQTEAPAGLPDGYLDIDVVVYNDIRTESSTASVTVLKGAPCENADTCADGQLCEDGRCFWEPASLGFGEACEFEQACLSGVCQGICTQACQVGVADACPEGYECETEAGGSTGFCGKPVEGGCCSAGDDRLGGRVALGGLVLLGLMWPRRRRQTPRVTTR